MNRSIPLTCAILLLLLAFQVPHAGAAAPTIPSTGAEATIVLPLPQAVPKALPLPTGALVSTVFAERGSEWRLEIVEPTVVDLRSPSNIQITFRTTNFTGWTDSARVKPPTFEVILGAPAPIQHVATFIEAE